MIKFVAIKKLLFLLLFFLSIHFSIFLFPKPVYAQMSMGPWYNQNFFQWFIKVYENSNPQEIFGERYTAAQVQWIFYSLVQLVPIPKGFVACSMTADFSGCVSEVAQMLKPLSDATPMNQRNIAERLEDVSIAMATIVTQERSISGIDYIKTSIAKLNASEVLAQGTEGTGYRGLSTVRSLWSAARDVTYVLMVLVIIVMSFMIMFKMKLSSQTVVSVQSSIWSVFKALILITFSYAIAGFAIDLMYITMAIISIIFTQTGVLVTNTGQNATLTIYKALNEGPSIVGAIPTGLLGFFSGYLNTFLTVYTFIILTPGSDILNNIATVMSISTSALLSTLAAIILSIILFFMFLKTMWIMIKTFVSILLLTITGPFRILIGTAFPGTGGFGEWFKSLVTHLAVYPVIGVLFLMSYIFLSGAFYTDSGWAQTFTDLANLFTGGQGFMIGWFGFGVNRDLFTGSGISTWTPPMTLGGYISLLWLFASFACISMIPKTVELIQSLISGKQFAYGTAIREAVYVPGVTGMYNAAKAKIQSLSSSGLGTTTRVVSAYIRSGFDKGSSSKGSGDPRGGDDVVGARPGIPRPSVSQTVQANQASQPTETQSYIPKSNIKS